MQYQNQHPSVGSARLSVYHICQIAESHNSVVNEQFNESPTSPDVPSGQLPGLKRLDLRIIAIAQYVSMENQHKRHPTDMAADNGEMNLPTYILTHLSLPLEKRR